MLMMRAQQILCKISFTLYRVTILLGHAIEQSSVIAICGNQR